MINKTLRRLAVGASAITVLGVLVPLAAATSASAATEAVGIAATPPTQTVSQGTQAQYTATLTPTGATSTNGVDYAITAGPSNVALSGTACDDNGSGTNTGSGPFLCDVLTTGFAPGTYTVTIFDDVANTSTFQSTDPNTTVSLTVAGTESAYTVSPATQSAAQNICVAYSGTAKDANGNAAVGQTVPLKATQSTATAQAGNPAKPNGPAFCTPTSPTFADATPASTQSGTSPAFTDTATSTANVQSDGTFTFGLKSDLTGTVNITVGGTQSSTNNPVAATLTVTNGTDTTNTQAANNDVAGGLTVTPTSQNAVAGSDAIYQVTVTNSTGQVIGGVLPSYVITSGADKTTTPVACDAPTNNKGVTTCTITTTTTTTDNVTTYVEQDDNAPNNATGPNAGEPQANSTVTVGPALTSPVITDSCGGSSAPATGTCKAAASAASQTVTFTLKSNNSGGTSVAAAGQTVTFSTTTSTYKLSQTSGTTDANGQVTVTVSHTAGTVENGNVKATFDNGGTNITDTPNVDFAAATATTLNLTPQNQTKAVGSQVTVTATATNTLKAGVAGDVINFTVKGPRNGFGTNAGATGSCTTAANGSCTFSYTDTGAAPLTGTGTAYDQVGATDSTSGVSTTADAAHLSNAPGAATAGSDATVTFVAGTATASTVTLTDTKGGTANIQPSGDTPPSDTVTATVTDGNSNMLANDTVTFTLTGVGNFVDSTGKSLGTSTTVSTGSDGKASVGTTSTTSGTQTVTATADGVSSSPFTITYGSANYNPVTPQRLVDTRSGQGGVNTGPLAPNTNYQFCLSKTGFTPTDGEAYTFNVTAIAPSGGGNLRIGPGTGTTPSTSLVNYVPGQTSANAVVVPNDGTSTTSNGVTTTTPGDGCFTLYSDGSSANVAIDITGYYANGSGAIPTPTPTPTRVADTRTGNGGTVTNGTTRVFQVAPASATNNAIALNVTAIAPTARGFLEVYPDGATRPTASNINYVPGQTKAAFVVIQLPASGKIDVYTMGADVNVTIDRFELLNATTPKSLSLQNPARIYDSRANGVGELQNHVARSVQVTGQGGVPADAQAVLISLTSIPAADSTGVGNLRAYPTGQSLPTVSTVNFNGTYPVANFAIIPIGTGGKIDLYSDGSNINAAVDVLGYVPAGG